MSRINDRNVREAFEVLESEFHSQEQVIEQYEGKISNLESDLEDCECTIEELRAKVQELEEALAEAYLTSEPDDESEENRDEVQCGRSADVPDTADDKATN